MATVGAVALGLATELATITGLEVFDYVPDMVNAPSGFVVLTAMHEDAFGGSSNTMVFDAIMVTDRSTERTSQRALYDFASASGPNSVWAAIDGNSTLGLSDGTRARVVNVRNLHVDEIAAYGYFGLAFSVEVTTPP